MKTDIQRDLIDFPTAIRAAKTTGTKLAKIREFERRHGSIPDELLLALARSQYRQGRADEMKFASE